MNKKVFLYSYNPNSEAAKLLAQAMGIKRIKHQNSRYRPKPGHTVINWGSTQMPFYRDNIINKPSAVEGATNKRLAFDHLSFAGVSVPDWTTNLQVALDWLQECRLTVVARTILNGSEGRGIVVVKPGEALPPAPLYVKYIPKKKEFRVHIVGGEVVDIQQKVHKRDDQGPVNFYIRNTANGFVFHRNNISCPGDLVPEAKKAVAALGLDFGAVDIVWNEKHNKCYVLEVNTAPGIMGLSVEKYKEALERLIALP